MYRYQYRKLDKVTTAMALNATAGYFDDADHGTTVPFSLLHPPEPGTVIYDDTPGSEQLVPYEDLNHLKAEKVKKLDQDTQGLVFAHYPLYRQTTLSRLLTDAKEAGNMPNRVAYIEQLWAWLDTDQDSVFNYFYVKQAEILAAPDKATLDAITWDFSALEASMPTVSIEQARSITD